ncbi:MAG: UbiD family decarboxylase [Desulfobacterales bacterium]|nr:UbiD family decarboxylase [Desulfobacterales bacterium]
MAYQQEKPGGEIAKDQREFVEVCRRTGDVVVVDQQVDWDLELGAISRHATEMDGPAVVFNNIKDYPGQSMFANPISTWRRAAITLGLPAHARIPEIYAEYIRRDSNPVGPTLVKDAACRDVIMKGDRVDLTQLATPLIHEGDGGRYLGTWCIVVSKDPDSGWVNWGTYRFMIHNKQYLSGWPFAPSHFGNLLRQKYLTQNKPMPVAIVMGADQSSHLAATSTTRPGRDEASLAGGLAGRSIEIAKCLDSDLTFPACAEVALEGEILPDKIAMEGPYGEYPGYRSGEMGAGILMKVNTVAHRKNPMLSMDCTGYKDCSSTVTALGGGIGVQRALERAGLPVTGVYIPSEGAVHLFIVGVQKGKGGRETTVKVLDALTRNRTYATKILVVEDDVDIFNLGEVLHAWATRCHSGRGIFIKHVEGSAQQLTPCYDQEERERRAGAAAAFDVTWPPSWDLSDIPIKATFQAMYPENLKKKVLDNWKNYGF